MQGMINSRFWENDFAPALQPGGDSVASASNLLAVVRPAIAHLEACRKEAVANQPVLDAFLFGARRMERIGQRMLDGLEAAQLYEQAYEPLSGANRTQPRTNRARTRVAARTRLALLARMESARPHQSRGS